MQENLTIQNIVFGYDFINITEMQTKNTFFVFHWKSELNKLYLSVGVKKPVANIRDKLKINIQIQTREKINFYFKKVKKREICAF